MGFIYWVASYPKSGNTWARAFLTSLIKGGLGDGLNPLGEIVPKESTGVFYQPFLRQPLSATTPAEFALARPHAQRRLAERAQNFLLLKTHSMVAMHEGTPTITPDVTAGAIYLVRNPLDVAVSYSEYTKRDLDRTIALMNTSQRVLDRPANFAYEIAGSWKENVESWTKPHRGIAVVRYEDLLADPSAGFRAIVKHLRMQVTDEQLDQAIADASFESLRRREKQAGFYERPPTTDAFFRSGRAGEWRDRLSEAQIAALALPNEAPMKRFGYWLDEFDDLATRHTAKTDQA